MDLITPALSSALAPHPLGSQEGLRDDAKVLLKFFFPASRYTFFVTEAQQEDGDWQFFGYCLSALGSDCDEWGYALFSELAGLHYRGLTIERDLHLPFARYTARELVARAA
jgi:hypothetical protein